jgi:hypothetical protein
MFPFDKMLMQRCPLQNFKKIGAFSANSAGWATDGEDAPLRLNFERGEPPARGRKK